jgi:2-polyprenyl-6-methoxyphenol hydroxylase-like FAD-dependent oxidoreductase
MWGISRRVLDETLFELARSAGATMLQPTRVERMDKHRVTVRHLATNALDQIQSRCILVADGKSSPTPDLGIKAHFSNIHGPRDAIELFGVRGHYGGLAPVEHGTWNASFSVPASRIRTFRGDLDGLFASIVGENATLRNRMCRARRVTEWLASPLPRAVVAAHWPSSQIPIGNAAASLEPIGGEGMGLAMRSAEIAANEIISATHENRAIDVDCIRAAYRDLWRVRSLACRAAARIASRPWLINLLAGAIDGREALPQAILRFVGKQSVAQ